MELVRILVGATVFGLSFFLKVNYLYIMSYLILGFEVILKSIKNISHGKIFDENFLMTIASIGAFALGDAKEAVAVMLLYCIGEYAQDLVEEKSHDNIEKLMDIEPDKANIFDKNGNLITISPSSAKVGDKIFIASGEKIPVDGIVTEGNSIIDTKSITGESMPLEVCVNSKVKSGTIVIGNPITVIATALYEDSTARRITKLVKEAQNNKAPTEKFITRFAEKYTPAVCSIALVLAILPPLFAGNWSIWIHRALIFLVISCPCALVLSVPLAFFAGMGSAAEKGILVKGGTELEKLARADAFAFDKTGTLTEGKPEVVSADFGTLKGSKKARILSALYSLEKSSNHPIAKTICEYCLEQGALYIKPDFTKEEPGLGLSGSVGGKTILCGNGKLLEKNEFFLQPFSESCLSTLFVVYDRIIVGSLVIEDPVKTNAKEAISSLKDLGIKHTALLSGDNENAVSKVAELVKVDSFYASLMPDEKVEKLREIQKNHSCAYVGDGINDAPVLVVSDVGISMGKIGSDSAIEASGIVIVSDNLEKLPPAVKLARKTLSIAKQNVVFALVFKFLCLVLGIFGLVDMPVAVFADTGVALLCVMNSMRTLSKH